MTAPACARCGRRDRLVDRDQLCTDCWAVLLEESRREHPSNGPRR